MLFSKNDIGLDIGEQKIKLVQISQKGNKMVVTSFDSMKTPPGSVEGGFIINTEKLGQGLAELVAAAGLKGKSAAASVAGQQIYTRLLTMPSMKINELRQAALYQASTFLPISIDEVTTDIYPVREFEDAEGRKTEVLFVAARRAQVDNLYDACNLAGLKLTRVEIEPLALYRVYHEQIDPKKVAAVLNIGAYRSSLAIFKDSIMVFMRTMSFGCSAFYEALNSSDPDLLETIDAVEGDYNNLLSDIIQEINRSVDYYEIQNKGDVIEKIVLCGGGSRIKNIDQYLSSGLNQQVIIGEPAKNIVFPGDINETEKKEMRYDFSVALGLALRGGE